MHLMLIKIAVLMMKPAMIGALGVVSAIVLLIARRRRLVDDHLHCRKCGFNLFMKPAETTRCPECGASLDRKRAVRIGLRQSRSRLLGMSVFMLALCSAVSGVRGYRAAKETNWNQYKPAWWLERLADGSNAQSRDIALAQLTRRIQVGTLSKSREAEMVSKSLAYQADQNRLWVAGWGDIVQAAHAAGRLDVAMWDQYQTVAVQLHLE